MSHHHLWADLTRALLTQRAAFATLTLLGATLSTSCSDLTAGSSLSQEDVEKGFYLSTSLWSTSNIPVCWEDFTESTEADRALIREAIDGSWARYSQLSFTGWGLCSSDASGIRITVDEGNPHVKALGRHLAGRKGGMHLNTTFTTWSPDCAADEHSRTLCMRGIAMHEFGHAIGFAHEQNRADTPSSCQDAPQGTSGDVTVGEWDLSSVMNYCNPLYNNDGVLSEGDVEMVQQAYGAPQGGSPTSEGSGRASGWTSGVTGDLCHANGGLGLCQAASACRGMSISGVCGGSRSTYCCVPQTPETRCKVFARCADECHLSDSCLQTCAREFGDEAYRTYQALVSCREEMGCGEGSCAPCSAEVSACGL